MPAIRGVVQCGARGMGPSEDSYRLYSCRRCAQQVRICRDCDRGHQYCADECARIRRRESLRRAGLRYQLSYRGACRHAARQSAWRKRQVQKVTHHASLGNAVEVIVVSTAITSEPLNVDNAELAMPVARPAAYWPARGRIPHRSGRGRCCFCGRRLARFAGFGPLRGGP